MPFQYSVMPDQHSVMPDLIGHLIFQGTIQLYTLIIPYRREESIVARRHNDHLVPWNGHGLDCRRVRRNHARGGHNVLPANSLPAMTPGKPVANCLIVVLRHRLVPKHAMVQPLLQCLQNLWRRLEVHIGHPHGQRPGGTHVPLYAFRPAAWDYFVKVVLHCFRFFTSFRMTGCCSK